MCRVLERHGWLFARIDGSHHIYSKKGRLRNIPVPAHGNRTLPAGTQRAIMRQAGLTDTDL
jgi:predicted RNA binding protein YcfA (HicA-like mRNA interferase family)